MIVSAIFFLCFMITLTYASMTAAFHFVMPANVYSALYEVVGYTYKFDGLLPINDIYNAIFWIITFEIVYFTINVIISLFNWARGSGSIDIMPK